MKIGIVVNDVIAQQYLPAAAEGDTRLFVMNGLPLQHEVEYVKFYRRNFSNVEMATL